MLRWYLYPVGDDNYLTVAAIGLLLVVLLFLVPLPGKASRGKRRVLLGLRLSVVVLVLFAMLRPTLVLTEIKRQAATLAFLLDGSRSMGVRDEVNNRSRWESLQKSLNDSRKELEKLSKDFEVKFYTFDGEIHRADFADGQVKLLETPDGQQTAIGAAMEDVLRQEAGKRLLGMVLMSDGAQRAYPPRDNLPQTAAGHLRQLGFPLYTVRLGQARGAGQGADAAVTELLSDQVVFVKNELTVNAEVRLDGFINRDIPVKVLVENASGKMEVVAQQTVKARSDGERIPVKFVYVPQTPGEFKLSVEIDPQTGEQVTTNNRLSTFINVLKGGLQVLYVEAFPGRQELPYLKRALASSPDIRVRWALLDPRKPDTRPPDMAEWFKPGKYDVYIFGDVDATAFKSDDLKGLQDAIDKGAGLIMTGGFHSFGPGGYADTSLADVLPVTMNRLEKQALNSPPTPDLHILQPIKMRPTQMASLHASLRLAPTAAENAELWSKLPPMDGANKLTPNRNALVLATTEQDQPLLVSREYGNGRVLAFAADSTWRWVLGGFEAAHKRFWRQTILWLAKKDETSEGNVWIKLPQRRFNPSDLVRFTSGAHSPTGEPVKNAAFKAEIQLADGTRKPLQLVAGEQEFSGSFRDTLQPGDYTIWVTGMAAGKDLGTAHSRFLVSEQDLELDNPLANATLLENLASMTGGQAVVPEKLPELLERLSHQTENLEVQTEVKHTFWDTWPFFLLLVGILSTEWFLRKRWGLV